MEDYKFDKLSTIAQAATDNARDFLNEARNFANEGKYGRAYAFLVMSLEEVGKSAACNIWSAEDWQKKNKSNTYITPVITDAKLKSVFKDHDSKRLTIITQAIIAFLFENKKTVKEIRDLLETQDTKEYKEILEIFRDMDTKRNRAFYIELDMTGPKTITKDDYAVLLKYAESVVEKSRVFMAFTEMDYNNIETAISKILLKEEIFTKEQYKRVMRWLNPQQSKN